MSVPTDKNKINSQAAEEGGVSDLKRGPRPWTEQEKRLLHEWREDGRSDEWIARRLKRTRGSVKNFIQYGASPPKKQKKERRCLCCSNPFMSWGAGNRLCDRCRAESQRASPLDSIPGSGCSVAARHNY